MEVKKDLIGKKSPSLQKIAKKHGVSISRLRRQLKMGGKVEREHTRSGPEAREIARDHLDEIPDYYTRLDKMEKLAKKHEDPHEKKHKQNKREWEKDKKAREKQFKKETGVSEGVSVGHTSTQPDILELLHRANAARIRQGAREGKFWLLRSEDVTDRKDLIKRIIETTMTSNIGTFNVGFGRGGDFRNDDPAFGGRNRFNKKQLRFAVKALLSRKSVPSPNA